MRAWDRVLENAIPRTALTQSRAFASNHSAGAILDAELAIHIVEVPLERAFRDEDRFGDLPVGRTLCICDTKYKCFYASTRINPDTDVLDPIGVERQILPDFRYRGVRCFVGPDRVD
jgi:hypothetical protein